MIVKKPADLDPAMKSALKNHIMRKRQQLKQELEQDAIEKRLKREQEAKRKQDAMTLDQLKEQLGHLEKTLDNLRNEKHSLFAQLKQNMRVLNEDDTRRKQKEGEINAVRQQQQQQHQQQPQHQPQQPPPYQDDQNPHQPQLQPAQRQQPQIQPPQPTSISNGGIQPPTNHENHTPAPREKQHDSQQNQQPHLFLQQQMNHLERSTPPINSHQPSGPHIQRPNSIFNSAAAFSHLLNAHNFPRQSPYLTHLPQGSRSTNPYGPLNSFPQLSHHAPPSLISGHGILTSLPHAPQGSPMIRPSPPPISNSSSHLNTGPAKLPPLSLPITSSGPSSLDFNPNLVTSTTHHIQQHAINNSAAATAAAAAALGIPYGPYFNSSSPIGPPITTHQALDHPVTSNHGHHSVSGGNNANSNVTSATGNSSRANPLPPMKRPISANDTLSPNKKMMHTTNQPQPPQSQSHQLPPSIPSPYLAYPGLPPGLSPGGGPSLPASLFGQNLMRTPPPPHISSLFNTAAFSHLLNAHNFPRQSPYLTHLPQGSRSTNPYGPLNSFPPLSHHGPPSLISGHGIPTSLPHVPQGSPMIRPSPPPISNSSSHLNTGPAKLPPLSLPITSSGPSSLDFNPNLVTSTAHHIQQHAINNSAAATAAAAAALGIPYGPYFNSSSPIGPPITTHQALEHHAAINAAAAAAAAASNHNHRGSRL